MIIVKLINKNILQINRNMVRNILKKVILGSLVLIAPNLANSSIYVHLNSGYASENNNNRHYEAGIEVNKSLNNYIGAGLSFSTLFEGTPLINGTNTQYLGLNLREKLNWLSLRQKVSLAKIHDEIGREVSASSVKLGITAELSDRFGVRLDYESITYPENSPKKVPKSRGSAGIEIKF